MAKLHWLLVIFMLFISGCDLDGQSNLPTDPPPGTGTDIWHIEVAGDVNDMAAAILDGIAGCGEQTVQTIPGGWQPVFVTTTACTMWAPSHWMILGQPNHMAFASDPTDSVYFFILQGVIGGGTQPQQAVDLALKSLAAQYGAPIPQVIYRESELGTGIAMSSAMFRLQHPSGQVVGRIRALVPACTGGGSCDASFMGFWMPEDQTDTYLCTMTQIEHSAQCP
jgi:hypothetical protein